MKQKIPCILITAGIVIILAAITVSVFIMTQTHTPDIGIIGGADGPTAIFVTKASGNPFLIMWGVGMVLLLVGTVFRQKNKRR